MNDDENLDNLILSLAETPWQKTAMIVARALDQCEALASEEFADRVTKRIAQLVKTGRLESRGDLARWRFSEVRLPTSFE